MERAVFVHYAYFTPGSRQVRQQVIAWEHCKPEIAARNAEIHLRSVDGIEFFKVLYVTDIRDNLLE